MNIHEHQAKEILKEFGAPISSGVVIFSIHEIKKKNFTIKEQGICIKSSNSCWRERKSRRCKINKERYRSRRGG